MVRFQHHEIFASLCLQFNLLKKSSLLTTLNEESLLNALHYGTTRIWGSEQAHPQRVTVIGANFGQEASSDRSFDKGGCSGGHI